MIIGNSDVSIEKQTSIEEFSGKLKFDNIDDKLMHSILENDKEKIEEGKTIKEAINQGITAFTPDLIFEQIVKSYQQAEKIFGKTLLKHISGYDPRYLERNIKIPEFQRELKKKIEENFQKLKHEELIDEEGTINEKGIELASLIMYIEELDNITAKGDFGQKVHKKTYIYGSKEDFRMYKQGDRYRDIAIKKSLKTAIRRKHNKLEIEDLKVHERESKGITNIIYGMDASGSMRGKKIETSKKAGIALAYKAIENKDKVGLITFGTKIKQKNRANQRFWNAIEKHDKSHSIDGNKLHRNDKRSNKNVSERKNNKTPHNIKRRLANSRKRTRKRHFERSQPSKKQRDNNITNRNRIRP